MSYQQTGVQEMGTGRMCHGSSSSVAAPHWEDGPREVCAIFWTNIVLLLLLWTNTLCYFLWDSFNSSFFYVLPPKEPGILGIAMQPGDSFTTLLPHGSQMFWGGCHLGSCRQHSRCLPVVAFTRVCSAIRKNSQENPVSCALCIVVGASHLERHPLWLYLQETINHMSPLFLLCHPKQNSHPLECIIEQKVLLDWFPY